MYFYSKKYDFWPIYESIKKYYPLGLDKEFNLNFDSPGYKELVEIVVNNIHDEKKFKSTWEDFCSDLEKALSKQIIGTTYGWAPCFSAYIKMEEKNLDDLVRTKELHFFVSILGPFYSIIGKDGSNIEFGKDRRYWITNYLTVSPVKEYAEIFSTLESKIIERFPNYRLVPFEILSQKLGGLYAKWYNEEELNVFNALFNNQIEYCPNISGDVFYGADKWIRKDYDQSQEGSWTVYPPKLEK